MSVCARLLANDELRIVRAALALRLIAVRQDANAQKIWHFRLRIVILEVLPELALQVDALALPNLEGTPGAQNDGLLGQKRIALAIAYGAQATHRAVDIL